MPGNYDRHAAHFRELVVVATANIGPPVAIQTRLDLFGVVLVLRFYLLLSAVRIYMRTIKQTSRRLARCWPVGLQKVELAGIRPEKT
jgi:hypothetical protein